MEARAKLSYARISPRKVKIVIDLIRNKPVGVALGILKTTPKAASPIVEKLLKSAIANAENNHNMTADNLYVKEIYANPGPILKRIMARAQGRAFRINKRTSHITVVVAEKESAGEGVATSEAFFAEANYTAVDTQSKAFTEVASGIADGCVVDYVCSIGMIGEGTDFTDLVVVDTLNFADEQYGIAFRKGSDVDDKVNAAITELVNDGTLAKIAAKYKLEEQVIAK